MKNRGTAVRTSFFLVCFFVVSALSLSGQSSAGTVNSAAALRVLERSSVLLGNGEWAQAGLEAAVGAGFAPELADFPYIRAVASLASGEARHTSIEYLYDALSAGRFWRMYNSADARVLLARLLAETGRPAAALEQLDNPDVRVSADADYARLLALYAADKQSERERLFLQALDRWSFDSRFPRLFFSREYLNHPNPQTVRIAEILLRRLYMWENEDRELLLLAVPFEPDPQLRIRNIRIFRGMGGADERYPGAGEPHALSALLALEYGLLDEREAVREFFSVTDENGSVIERSYLERLAGLLGASESRLLLATLLSGFDGSVYEDRDKNSVPEVIVRYNDGRPVYAVFDPDQDGLPELEVFSELGSPVRIRSGGIGPAEIRYTAYPVVSVVTRGDREYAIKPGHLRWEPLRWSNLPMTVQGTRPFVLYDFRTGLNTLSDTMLLDHSAWYRMQDSDRIGGEVRVNLEQGKPLAAEYRLDGRVYAWSSYTNGRITMRMIDHDGDGRLETTELYDRNGSLVSVQMDTSGNRSSDYTEEYKPDGTAVFQWDTTGDGIFDIVYSRFPSGRQETRWLHPDSGLPVTVISENNYPRSVAYGSVYRPVTVDPDSGGLVWWIGRRPADASRMTEILLQNFNPQTSRSVVFTTGVNGRRLYAVQTGGLVYAELLDE